MEKTCARQYGKAHEGEWFPCQMGIHILRAVIEEAQRHGFEVGEEAWLEPEHEWHHELFCQAENYMNEMAMDGFAFGHLEFDGSWGLWPKEFMDTTWEDEDR